LIVHKVQYFFGNAFFLKEMIFKVCLESGPKSPFKHLDIRLYIRPPWLFKRSSDCWNYTVTTWTRPSCNLLQRI